MSIRGTQRVVFAMIGNGCFLVPAAGANSVGIKFVSIRLGRKCAQITMDVYQRVLPDMQEDAGAALKSVLFG